jgi:hypothetical protein
MNQPEQTREQDIPEFLEPSAFRTGKRQVRQLSHRAAYCDRTLPEVVDDTEPVLVIDRREISVEALRVDQKRSAGNEWLLPAPGQAPRMPHHGRIRVFLYLEPYDRIVIQ